MSSSDPRTQLKLVTVGDFDPGSESAIEYDFIGRVIAGRYTVQEKIGGGGMAEVFRAVDGQLGIAVAIKLLKPRMASDELRARMVQEAQAAAQVRHANLVRVYGTGTLDRTAYIAMEMLDGPNLEQYLREHQDQRLPWRQALELLLPALEALHAVHERGYVHRDIKPGNILVSREPGSPPTAIVIDLGLVKPDRALRNAASPPTTETGRMLCTPGYTSPEQAAGLPVDRRSDVYSMAITLYRVLAGRLPFHDVRGQAMFAVLAKHIYNEPTLLAVAAAGAEIPPGIAAVVESGLRKKPGERPQTMLAFAEALRAAAAQVPAAEVTAAPVSSLRRRPHGLLLVLAALVVLAWVIVPEAGFPVVVRREPEAMLVPAPRTWVVAEAPVESSRIEEMQGPMPMIGEEVGEQGDRVVAARRALGRRVSVVQGCVDATGGDIERLRIAMKVDTAGRVVAHVVDAADTPLSRCIAGALRKTRLDAPDKPLAFVQTFELRSARRP